MREERLLERIKVWEKEFEILPSSPKWHNEIEKSIAKTIKKFEQRLDYKEIIIFTKQSNNLKKRIEIHIKAKVKKTSEDFEQTEIIYLSPRSLD